MKPVAPEVTPVTFEPVLVPAEGVADIVSFVNIRMSKRYNLYSASAVITSTPEPVSFAECSIALHEQVQPYYQLEFLMKKFVGHAMQSDDMVHQSHQR